jgi:NAD(P)-dependent dehydrogenase (short-subunit alcohol dehydrogenase family)
MGSVSFDFSGETVIVTGGSSGIGREIALEFGDAGATVVNADVREDPIEDALAVPTHEAVRERGGEATYVEVDVAEPDQLREAVATAREYGGVDVMVNNAGIYTRGPLRTLDPEDYDRVQDVNVKGVFYGCQAAAADMIDRGVEGTILINSSTESELAERDQVHYSASKGAVKMIVRGAARELAEFGIRVAAVAPGHIDTIPGGGDTGATQESHDAGELLKKVPLGRVGAVEDVAPAFLFLASDAADYVTGEQFFIDGGLRTY